MFAVWMMVGSLKDLLYGDLVQGKRNVGRPKLRFKHMIKRDMSALKIDIADWEETTLDRSKWRSTVRKETIQWEENSLATAASKRRATKL